MADMAKYDRTTYSSRYFNINDVFYHNILLRRSEILQKVEDIPVIVGHLVTAAGLISKRIRFVVDNEVGSGFKWEDIKNEVTAKVKSAAKSISKICG